MEGLLQQLLSEAGDPSAKVKGVPDSFLDGLERIPRNKLKKVISEMSLKPLLLLEQGKANCGKYVG